MLKKVTESEILQNVLSKEDNFAKTVIAKCNTYDLWDECFGFYDGDELVGLIVATISKRAPHVANLQLLFTYSKHRNNGYARQMVETLVRDLHKNGSAGYFRVSSEKTAVGFYEKLGFVFQCEQKSGTRLSIMKITSSKIPECQFSPDETMNKMLHRKGKGGCHKMLVKYDESSLSFGFELEVSNVPKNYDIPQSLGKWEQSELDIINTKGDYAFICADPQGVTPPVGGEINTIPSKTYVDQVNKIVSIIDMFDQAGFEPDCGITSHSHVHVAVDGLKDDPASLIKLTEYIYNNQDDTIELAYRYDESKITDNNSKLKRYLKFDGGRKLPSWFVENVKNHTTDWETYHQAIKMGKNQQSIRHQRYHINLHALHTSGTIEFRCFRGTLNKNELLDIFRFAKDFVLAALNGGPTVKQLFDKNEYSIPPMQYDELQAKGWVETKHSDSRCKGKNREFWEADEASSDTVEEKEKGTTVKTETKKQLHVINFMGANGVGKSTRTMMLVRYLRSKYGSKPFSAIVTRKDKDPKEEVVGELFDNGWLVLGKESKGGTQWVSLDAAFFSKWEQRLEILNNIATAPEYDQIHTVFMEGYFNNRSKAGSPKNIKENGGAHKSTSLICFYDDIKDFIERTNGRTGRSRGMDWASNSAGWKDNESFRRMLNLYTTEMSDEDEVTRVDINEPVDFLVRKFFNTNFEYNAKPKPSLF